MRLGRLLWPTPLTPTLSRWRGRGSCGRRRGRGSLTPLTPTLFGWRGRGGSGRWRGRGSLTPLTPTLSGWRGRGGSVRWRGRGSLAVARLEHRDLGPGLHRLTLLGQDLAQDPGHGRRHLGVDLVGVDLEHGLDLDDLVPRLDQPARDRALVHRLAQLRHHDARGLARHQYAARSFKTFVILSGVGM